MNKTDIRSHLKSQRSALNAQQVAEHSQLICSTIKKQYTQLNETNFGLYLPFGNEINLTSLQSDSSFIPSVKSNRMQFQRFIPTLNIQSHPLGMKQPSFDEQLNTPALSICFLPLLGFDTHGHRLGMGGGFYDRYFENNEHNTVLIGVAHDCQQWPSLPHDKWDVKLHAIVTESQYITF